jgi:hypothetical protein
MRSLAPKLFDAARLNGFDFMSGTSSQPPNCSLILLRSDFVIEKGYQMDRTSCSAVSRHTLHCALELSKNSWLLAIQFPDREQPSVYSIEGGDTEKLMAKLTAARDCWAKVIGSLPVITLCYEVGYDAFFGAVPEGRTGSSAL